MSPSSAGVTLVRPRLVGMKLPKHWNQTQAECPEAFFLWRSIPAVNYAPAYRPGSNKRAGRYSTRLMIASTLKLSRKNRPPSATPDGKVREMHLFRQWHMAMIDIVHCDFHAAGHMPSLAPDLLLCKQSGSNILGFFVL